MEHMIVEQRIEWLSRAAAAIGFLGLVGLASAQAPPVDPWTDALVVETTASGPSGPVGSSEVFSRDERISDDGWSSDLPSLRQLMVARKGPNAGPLVIDLFNERGELVERMHWVAGPGALRPIELDALAAGRYVVRVASSEQSTVIRFRKD